MNMYMHRVKTTHVLTCLSSSSAKASRSRSLSLSGVTKISSTAALGWESSPVCGEAVRGREGGRRGGERERSTGKRIVRWKEGLGDIDHKKKHVCGSCTSL